MREPDNLGRLIAAERNALAAIEASRNAMSRLGAMEADLLQARQQSLIFAEQINALQVKLALMRGNGPSER